MSLRFVFTILALYKFVCMYVCKNGRCMYVKSVYLTIRHHCICTVTERYYSIKCIFATSRALSESNKEKLTIDRLVAIQYSVLVARNGYIRNVVV